MRVLVTGASGFVGSALVRRLAQEARWQVRAAVHARSAAPAAGVEVVTGPSLGPDADWRSALHGVDVVVHVAARVHVMRRPGPASDAAFHRINVDGTAGLARQAAAAGVRRVVFLSSVKVHGEEGRVGPDSPMAPDGAYAVSKRDAELALRAIATETALEVVIVRPPLVYGPGAKANMGLLVAAVRRGIPLPLGAIANRRSFVGIDNLVEAIVCCLETPAAASGAFLVSDDEDVSTPDLVRRLASALGRPARLWPAPVGVLRLLGAIAGRREAIARLTTSLYLDVSRTRQILGWAPRVSLDEGLRRMVGAP